MNSTSNHIQEIVDQRQMDIPPLPPDLDSEISMVYPRSFSFFSSDLSIIEDASLIW